MSASSSASASESSEKQIRDGRLIILSNQLHTAGAKVSYLSLYRYADGWDCLVIFISAICAVAGGAAMPLFTILLGQLTSSAQGFFNDSTSHHDFTSQLVKNTLYFIYIGIVQFTSIFISILGFIYTGDRIVQRLRVEYLRAILRQNIGYFDILGAGEVTTRITADTNLVQEGISEKVALTLTALGSFFTAFIIAYIKYWKLALICSSTFVFLVILMVAASISTVKFSRRSLQSYTIGSSLAEQIISSIRTVTAFGSQEKLAMQYEIHIKAASIHGLRLQVFMAILVAAHFSLIFLNYALGFWTGSHFLVKGEVEAGQVVTILTAVLLGSFSIVNVAPHGEAFANAVAAMGKIYGTIDRISPLDPTTGEGNTLSHVEGTVELQNVKHIYPSRPDITVMSNVSLLIPAGKTTALVGASGSGKSTIISLIERFYQPVQGSILLDRYDIQTLNLRWLRQQVSLVSQEPRLFATSIFENIKFGLVNSVFENESEHQLRERVKRAARTANAHDFIMELPEGYETQVGERGNLLSGGQRQRICIARAIIKNPKILLLDEATSALDTKSEGIVQAALDKAAEGRTTVVIAHRLSTIKTAHKIVVFDNGHIAEEGSHENLLNRNGIYSKLVAAQRMKELSVDHRIEAQGLNGGPPQKETIGDGTTRDLTEQIPSEIAKFDRILEKTTKVQIPEDNESNIGAFKMSDETSPKYSLWTLTKFTASFNHREVGLMLIGLCFAVLAGGGRPSQAILYSKAAETLIYPPSLYKKLRHDANLWSLLLLTMGILLFTFYLIHGVLFAFCSEKLGYRARSQGFRAILRQDVAFFDRPENNTGALTLFLSLETKRLSGISGGNLGTLLNISTTFVASLIIALAVGWKMALVCISFVPILLGCGYYRFWMLAEFEAKAKRAYYASGGYACEAILSIRTIASLNLEHHTLSTYSHQLEQQARENLISAFKSSLLYAASQGLGYLCMALGFWYGGTLLGKRQYSIFQFFLCFRGVIFGTQSAATMFSFAPDMGKAKAAAAELKRLFDRKPLIDVCSEVGEHIDGMEGAIEFRNVHFRYDTRPDQQVLQGLSLTIKPGQYVAFVGPSGCGKSTAIALLERFYDVSLGAIYVDGRDISNLNVNQFRSFLSLVSQDLTLYHGTIQENILLGSNSPDVPHENIVTACKSANIYDFILSLPDGFDTLVGNGGIMLSGGQKQRITLARALLRDPKILLLDEATSALDSESEKVVQAALNTVAQDRSRTIIAVAHRLSTIQDADIIYVFDHGRIVESGTHQSLILNKGQYYELVNLQTLEEVPADSTTLNA
ncbi:P-loop containing nucleoside triphosphate hydrolase protein [Xylogone sp. PMI_703]|nr:P-loop containing nucleoside triphosphate hydrolase protein [Xylogone sp. PMI_703]